MSDFPKRLRYEATWFEGEDMHDLLRESADALERVERALNEARKALLWCYENLHFTVATGRPAHVCRAMNAAARAAGKKMKP